MQFSIESSLDIKTYNIGKYIDEQTDYNNKQNQFRRDVYEQIQYALKENEEFKNKQKTLMNRLHKFKLLISNEIYKIINGIKNNLKEQSNEFQIIQNLFDNYKEQQLQSNFNKIYGFQEILKKQVNEQLQELKIKLQIDSLFDLLQDNTIQQINKINQQKTNTELKLDKRIEYQLLKQSTIWEKQYCCSIIFSNQSSNLILACDKNIKIYQFDNGKIEQELQTLIGHELSVHSLLFIESSCQIISGSYQKMIVWKQDENNNGWVIFQQIKEHKNWISSIIKNNNESVIVSGSEDGQIKFWNRNEGQLWLLQQTINAGCFIFALSINESNDKIIASGSQNCILVIEKKENHKWYIVQKIKVEQYGYRLCFITDSVFVSQVYYREYFEVYKFDECFQEFKKQFIVKIKNSQCCSINFPFYYIKNKNILVIKNSNFVNIVKVVDQNEMQVVQTIQFKDSKISGAMSDDGEYLVTWDYKTKQVQVRVFCEIN